MEGDEQPAQRIHLLNADLGSDFERVYTIEPKLNTGDRSV